MRARMADGMDTSILDFTRLSGSHFQIGTVLATPMPSGGVSAASRADIEKGLQ
jgi:hypothetical protein